MLNVLNQTMNLTSAKWLICYGHVLGWGGDLESRGDKGIEGRGGGVVEWGYIGESIQTGCGEEQERENGGGHLIKTSKFNLY